MRVHVAQATRSQIATWIRQSDTEIGGLLIGRVQKSGDLIRRVRVEAAIFAEGAPSVGNSIRFTPDLLAELTAEAKRQHPTFEVLGWFHTHNGLGAFFSSYDQTVQQEYFPHPWQVALVLDPVVGQEAVYVWGEGEMVPYSGDTEDASPSLVSGIGNPPRWRLVYPLRLLSAVLVVILLIATGVGYGRWRASRLLEELPRTEQTGQTGEPQKSGPDSVQASASTKDPAGDQSEDEPIDPADGTLYTVQKSDTLWRISEQFYGDGMYFGIIVEKNEIDDPREIEPGQRLIIPPSPHLENSP